jgi:hypothetical protein
MRGRFLRGVSNAALPLAAVLLAGCGGGGGGGGGPVAPGNAPVIADLTGSFPAGICSVGDDAGTPRQLVFSYTDADGDVSGGQVSVQARFDSGVVVAVVAPAPAGQPPAGTITFNTCVVFKDNTAVTETVVLVDAAGHSSNVLTLTTPRPPGAPERRRAPIL